MASLINKSSTPVLIAPLTVRDSDDQRPAAVLEQAAALWKLGASFDGLALYEGEQRSRIPLPVYPLNGERHWWGAAVRQAVAR
jgi:acyl transferase domain-containing protein